MPKLFGVGDLHDSDDLVPDDREAERPDDSGEDDDAWTPATQAAMAERLTADTVVIPGAAHSPAVEALETTASALTAFWAEADKSSPARP